MKGFFRKLLLMSCLIASMVIPVYANAPPRMEGESATAMGSPSILHWDMPDVLILGFIVLACIVITCFCEWLVSLLFQLNRRNSRLVIWTNVISQILMWAAYILLCGILKLEHLWVVVILEVLIYTGEFLFYRKKMHEVSWLKCLLYTVTANTASLLAGLLIL